MLGAILSFFVLLIICFFIIAGLIGSASKEQVVSISKNSILHIGLNFPISERTSQNPFENFDFNSFENVSNPGLNDILKSIDKAKDDNNIAGIYLDLDNITAGLSTVEEIRNALIRFKESGKFIISYSEVYTQKAYYLASVADQIYLNPAGLMELRGFSSNISFIKGALAKLEIEPQVIRVGTFKSAIEPLILDKMSDANREQTTAFMGSMYDHFIGAIAESRAVNKDSLFVIADQLLIQEPEDAIKYKMVDQLAYKDEVLDILCKKTGVSNEKDLKMVTLKKYKNVPSINISTAKDKIAVIYAVGSIEGGNGDDQTIGSERISKAIRTARMDQHVKAIVLRINSPGGSALASDVIWREVELARKIKPVVASMGDVAASGGYYIACAADTIIAQPTTITGSIGVFGVLFNSQKLFNNKLGITFDGVKTGKYADLGSAVRPLTDSERLIIQNSVNKIYEDFTTKVAEGRKMPLEEVKKIAEGRVWSGTDAQRIGLVDVLGNFDDAVRIAAQMAKLADYRVISLPEQTDPFSKIMNDLSGDASAWITAKQLGEQYQYYKQVQEALKMQGVQARLPFDMNIR